MVVWTPFCFEVENKEVIVLVVRQQVMNQPDFDIFNRMSEGTILLVLAVSNFVRVTMAELSLVLVFVVKPFDSIVSSLTLSRFGTSVSVSELAKFWGVGIVISSPILAWMEKVAAFMVVWTCLLRALECFERIKNEVPYSDLLPWSVVCLREYNKVVIIYLNTRFWLRGWLSDFVSLLANASVLAPRSVLRAKRNFQTLEIKLLWILS